MSVSSLMPLADGHLAYEVRGPADAPSCLILGGGPGGSVWGQLRDGLSRRLRVVSFDPRGHGLSSVAPPGWSEDDVAEDAMELLDLLAIDRTHVVGISRGGEVALRLAIAHPERLDHLVIASAGAPASDVWQALGAVAAPTLVLAWRRDRLRPPGAARAVASRIPGARLRLLADGLVVAARPQALARAIRGFLLHEPERREPPMLDRCEATP